MKNRSRPAGDGRAITALTMRPTELGIQRNHYRLLIPLIAAIAIVAAIPGAEAQAEAPDGECDLIVNTDLGALDMVGGVLDYLVGRRVHPESDPCFDATDGDFYSSTGQSGPAGVGCDFMEEVPNPDCYYYVTDQVEFANVLLNPGGGDEGPIGGGTDATLDVVDGQSVQYDVAVTSNTTVMSALNEGVSTLASPSGRIDDFPCVFSSGSGTDTGDDYLHPLNPVGFDNSDVGYNPAVDVLAVFHPYYYSWARSVEGKYTYQFLICATSEMDAQDGHGLIEYGTVVAANGGDVENRIGYVADDTVDDGRSSALMSFKGTAKGFGLEASLGTNPAGRNFYTKGTENASNGDAFSESTASTGGWKAANGWNPGGWSTTDQRQVHSTLYEFPMFTGESWTVDDYWVGYYLRWGCRRADFQC